MDLVLRIDRIDDPSLGPPLKDGMIDGAMHRIRKPAIMPTLDTTETSAVLQGAIDEALPEGIKLRLFVLNGLWCFDSPDIPDFFLSCGYLEETARRLPVALADQIAFNRRREATTQEIKNHAV